MCARTSLKFQLLCMYTNFPPTVMLFGVMKGSEGGAHNHSPIFPQDFRINTDADAYVETLQTIVVKPPWIDSAANGGRSYIFQQDSAPSHKPLKSQD
ncbi:hypothetical protein ACTXT7_008820 [Hymenolepis weldensis]